MMTFGDVAAIKGHTPTAELIARPKGPQVNFAEDVLIYAMASGTEPNSVKYFRLELPAEAFGGRGTFHIQIPVSRLQNLARPTFD